jgi:hypothetical protein
MPSIENLPVFLQRVYGRQNPSNEDVTPVWRPIPDSPQQEAANSAADITGYGGAAGGGKTDLEIGLALTEHRKAIVFRREYGQLRDIIFRTKEILSDADDEGQYNGSSLLWRFNDGRTLELGAVQKPDDWRKYRGRPHDYIGFDEVTEFQETQVRALMGWLRSTEPERRCRVVMTFNPPTHTEGMWVLSYFAPWLDETHPNPAMPGDLRWYAMIDGEETERPNSEPFDHNGETIVPTSRTFFPARLGDNPYLSGTNYGATLQSLPEPLRSQLLYGDFKAGVKEDAWQLIPTAWIKAAQARWRADGATVKQSHIGMDVAHGGRDKTVLAPRHGDWFAPLVKVPGAKTPDGQSAAAILVQHRTDDSMVLIDAIGYGASAAERLRDPVPEGYGIARAHAINVASGSPDYRDKSRKFKVINKRAEMYWRLREALDPEGDHEISLPPDAELLADLAAPKYEITPSGLKIESKDKIAERLKRSPDCGDAVALSMLEGRILRTW